MGRSVTCNFAVHVNYSNGTKVLSSQTCYGAMTFKDALGCLLAEHSYQTCKALKNLYSPSYEAVLPVNAEIWPQTAKGRNQIKKDYAIIDLKGNVEHREIQKEMFQIID